MESVAKYSIPNALTDLQIVLESQYKDLKRLELNRTIDSSNTKELQHRKESIASLENILGCIHEAKKTSEELQQLKTATIKHIETFYTIFKQ